MSSRIDHIVVTAPDLGAGAVLVRRAFGVALQTGGEHVRMGTHNLLLRLGEALFLEVLNVTYSESVYGLRYPEVDGVMRYDMPQHNGFRWILPSIGLRGRF